MTNFRAEDMPGNNIPTLPVEKEEKKTSKPAAKAEPKKAAPKSTRSKTAASKDSAPAEAEKKESAPADSSDKSAADAASTEE